MPPTPAQRAFCDRYRGQDAQNRAYGPAALFDKFADIEVPAAAMPEEQADLRVRIWRARTLLDGSGAYRESNHAKEEIGAVLTRSAQIVDWLNKSRAAGLLRSLTANMPEGVCAPSTADDDRIAKDGCHFEALLDPASFEDD